MQNDSWEYCAILVQGLRSQNGRYNSNEWTVVTDWKKYVINSRT